jgi:hypothetical protein
MYFAHLPLFLHQYLLSMLFVFPGEINGPSCVGQEARTSCEINETLQWEVIEEGRGASKAQNAQKQTLCFHDHHTTNIPINPLRLLKSSKQYLAEVHTPRELIGI